MHLSAFAWIAIAGAALSAVVLLWYLVARPPLDRTTKIALLFGIGVFPLATAGSGNYAGFEATKAVRFCGSCHVMTPILEALSSDKESLASIHYRRGLVPHDEACYTCHSGYGIWGTMDAKMAGVMHMVRTLTGNYKLPIELHGTFDINSCLNCHATSQAFRDVKEHQDPEVQKALLSHEMSCTGVCHPEAHPASALTGGVDAAAGGVAAK